MLGSITPLGERGRGARWGRTVVAFVLGSVAAGAGLGLVLGWAGGAVVQLLGPPTGALRWVLVAAVAAGILLDARLFGLRLPSVRRQVNEDWLRRYRDWVYGLAFGFQLGLGVVTIVSISAVYLTFLSVFLLASPAWGALIGGVFGLLRALPVLGTAPIRRTDQLAALDRALRRWDRPAWRVAVAGEVVMVMVATLGAVA
jgi:hypothetical protein